MYFLVTNGGCHSSQQTVIVYQRVHPGRLTWNLKITYLKRKIIFQTSMIMFHVNLAGCNCLRFFSPKNGWFGAHAPQLEGPGLVFTWRKWFGEYHLSRYLKLVPGKQRDVNSHQLKTPKTSHSCLTKKVLSYVFQVAGKHRKLYHFF